MNERLIERLKDQRRAYQHSLDNLPEDICAVEDKDFDKAENDLVGKLNNDTEELRTLYDDYIVNITNRIREDLK